METEVYADILFFVNFSMDFLTLYLCARLGCRPLSPVRACAAAAIGALYAVLALLLPAGIPLLLTLALDAAICLVLCAIGLWRRAEGWRSLLRLSAAYLLVSALLGGLMTLLFNAFNRLVDGESLAVEESRGSTALLLLSLAAPLCGALAMLLSRVFRRSLSKRTVTLRLCEGESCVTLRALCDNGNLLREPLSSLPVVPVSLPAAAACLPPQALRLFSSPHPCEQLEALPPDWQRRTRLIPAGSAVGHALLPAYLPDALYLLDERGHSHPLHAYIAPVTLPSDKEYAAILPTELLLAL